MISTSDRKSYSCKHEMEKDRERNGKEQVDKDLYKNFYHGCLYSVAFDLDIKSCMNSLTNVQ
jgi:hypothetical protein